ncbi:MAG: phosphoglycerate dehydrogenase [Deferribacterales bacterium]
MKVFVSTHPFSETTPEPMALLKKHNIDVALNRYERKLTSAELAQEVKDADVIIAGTENITEEVFKNAPNLKLISRVGVGLDGVDFELCRRYGVRVAYTPEAPTTAVAELCVGMMLDLARQISQSDNLIRSGKWKRHMGMLLYGKTIGIIGMGRIGKSLAHMLSGFNVNILAHDISPDIIFGRNEKITYTDKATLLKNSDIVSVNLPLKKDTRDFITLADMRTMQPHAFLINTARGGIVNEDDLYEAVTAEIIAGAGVDVFNHEPYIGKLTELKNVIMTCHMGAATIDSRYDMEIQSVEEAVRFLTENRLKNEVFSNE